MGFSYTYQLSGEGNGTPLQYSCLENPMGGGNWWAAVHGVAKSRTRLTDFTFTFHFHALEKEMATHSSVLAWRIPGTGEPGGLPSMGSHRVRHDWSGLAPAPAIYQSPGHLPLAASFCSYLFVFLSTSAAWSQLQFKLPQQNTTDWVVYKQQRFISYSSRDRKFKILMLTWFS